MDSKFTLTTAADANRVNAQTIAGRMGINFLEVSPERVVATMPVAENTQPLGLLHGGASALLAETVGSVAGKAWAGRERAAVGTDLSITHLRSVRTGTVTATASALHLGGTSAIYAIDIRDDNNRPVAHARLSTRLIELRS